MAPEPALRAKCAIGSSDFGEVIIQMMTFAHSQLGERRAFRAREKGFRRRQGWARRAEDAARTAFVDHVGHGVGVDGF